MTSPEHQRAIDDTDAQPRREQLPAGATSVYQLREAPFTDTRDPRFLYLGQSHQEALASLYYGVESGTGFQTLIAAPGMGKTTLLLRVLERWRGTRRTVFLIQHGCTSHQLLQYLLGDIGGDASGLATLTMHQRIRDAFAHEPQAGRRFVVVLDEAESLEEQTLETIGMLATLEPPHPEFLQIVFAARPEFEKRLARPQLAALRARITFANRLRPLSVEDTRGCIEHRLKAAGHPTGEIFTPEAIDAIARASGGVPREICAIASAALSAGGALGQPIIDVDVVREIVSTRVPPEPESVAEAGETTLAEMERVAPDATWWTEVSNARRALQRELEEDDNPRPPVEEAEAQEAQGAQEAQEAHEAPEAHEAQEEQRAQKADEAVEAHEAQGPPYVLEQVIVEAEETRQPDAVAEPAPQPVANPLSRGAARREARDRQRAEAKAVSRGGVKKDRRPRKPPPLPKAPRSQGARTAPMASPPIEAPLETVGVVAAPAPEPEAPPTPEASPIPEALPIATPVAVVPPASPAPPVSVAPPRQPQPAAPSDVDARFAAALLAWDAVASRAIAAAAPPPGRPQPTPPPAPLRPAPSSAAKAPRLNAIAVLSAIGYYPAVTPRVRRRRNVIVAGAVLLLLVILLLVVARTGR